MSGDRPSVPLGPGEEFDRIRRFLTTATSLGAATLPASVLVGPGDDCAILRAGTLAISTDASVEGVHFRRAWLGADEIGWRAAAAALSDLAAVAARPIGLLVSLAAGTEDSGAYADQIVHGIAEAAASAGAALLGGDLSASPGPLFLDVAVLGEAPAPVLRTGARAGDELWVTGTLGAAAAAVLAWRGGQEPPAEARAAFARPRPRIREALWLQQEGLPRAMLDISDGLAGDAAHLAAASGVRVLLEPALVPVATVAQVVAPDGDDALRLALSGGEDYELCFAATAGAVEARAEEFTREFGLPLTRVGRITDGAGIARLEPDGTVGPLELTGYRHFAAQGNAAREDT